MIQNQTNHSVPQGLKTWFVIHFIADLIFALPFMFFPTATLEFFGWQQIDPITTRIVAAALFGIGIESFLGRNAGAENYRSMLRLKIIWSASAILGFILSIAQNAQGNPLMVWLLLLIFILFNLVWIFWYRQLTRN